MFLNSLKDPRPPGRRGCSRLNPYNSKKALTQQLFKKIVDRYGRPRGKVPFTVVRFRPQIPVLELLRATIIG